MSTNGKLEEGKKLLRDQVLEVGYLDNAFKTLSASITSAIDSAIDDMQGLDDITQKVARSYQKDITQSINKATKGLETQIDLTLKINAGKNVGLEIDQKLKENEARRLVTLEKISMLEGISSKEKKKLLGTANDVFKAEALSLKILKDRNEETQKNKSLTQLLLENAGDLADKLDKSGTLSKVLSGNIMSTVTPVRLFEIAVLGIFNAFKGLDTQTAKVAEALGVSYHEAQGMNKEFSQIAQNSNNVFVTTVGVAKSQVELSKILGTNARFTDEMLQTQTELTHQLGLSAETSGEIAKLGLLTGKTSKEIASNVLGQSVAMNAANGTALTEQQILEDVAKLSSSIQLSMANNPIELAKAVQTAKQFGMELSQVDGIANSLMNFEQSIGAELEAELLLGKNINLEKARTAALNNELSTVAEEIAKITGTAAQFSKMDRIQQEALAKAVGMSKEDLAKSLQDREVLAALGAKEGTALEAYNKLKKKGLSDEAIATKLGDKNLANSLHQESIQARFAASLNKVKELFVQIADGITPIVEPIADVVGYMASLISGSLKYIKVLGSIVAVMKVIKFIGNDVYRQQILTNVANKLGLLTENQKKKVKLANSIIDKGTVLSATQKAMIERQNVVTLVKGNAIKIKDAVMDKASNAYKSVKLGLENAILAVSEGDYLLKLKKNISDKISGAYDATKLAVTSAIGIVNKVDLGTIIAKRVAQVGVIIGLGAQLAIQTAIAAAALVGVSASTVGIGTVVALAAAAAGIAYLMSVSVPKADDMMSPGANSSGYGSRTLMGPEGAIALNNKDTVIAGTNLFPKGNDVISGPAGAIQMPDNSEAKRTNTLLSKLINRPDPVIEMNGDKLGTAVGKYAYSVQ